MHLLLQALKRFEGFKAAATFKAAPTAKAVQVRALCGQGLSALRPLPACQPASSAAAAAASLQLALCVQADQVMHVN